MAGFASYEARAGAAVSYDVPGWPGGCRRGGRHTNRAFERPFRMTSRRGLPQRWSRGGCAATVTRPPPARAPGATTQVSGPTIWMSSPIRASYSVIAVCRTTSHAARAVRPLSRISAAISGDDRGREGRTAPLGEPVELPDLPGVGRLVAGVGPPLGEGIHQVAATGVDRYPVLAEVGEVGDLLVGGRRSRRRPPSRRRPARTACCSSRCRPLRRSDVLALRKLVLGAEHLERH